MALGRAKPCLGDVLEDPGHESGYPRAHPRQVLLRTSDAPGNDAREEVAAVSALHLQWPA